jgi:hypothetical protein
VDRRETTLPGSWTWWLRPVVPALGRKKLEDRHFQANLGYIVSPCLRKKTTNKQTKKPTNKNNFPGYEKHSGDTRSPFGRLVHGVL